MFSLAASEAVTPGLVWEVVPTPGAHRGPASCEALCLVLYVCDGVSLTLHDRVTRKVHGDCRAQSTEKKQGEVQSRDSPYGPNPSDSIS